ncbi:pectin esterase [Niastella caeni]|uniref:Pectinesterase n=1 Tax=Niastella caeni TaxID=2569763 RepID=A0A4S8HMD0_9BACT|nr:pectinesterase family protein [Niastella caeni]THU34132.1 pectin esterase [Niastella caeni]
MKRVYLLLMLLVPVLHSIAQQQTYPTHLTVAQDGSGNYKTIQEAVNAMRDFSQERVTIFIKKGVYKEKLVIPSWKTNISLVGESRDSTIITNDDYSGKPYPDGKKDATGSEKFRTFTSYTVLVQGNDFSAENLTIQNTAGRVGQAVALHAEGDRCVVLNCRLLGNQDTLYVGIDSSRQYYRDCHIEGTTDFIFGPATVVFQRCTIKSLANSYITAASTTQRQAYGLVFLNCTLIAADTGATKVLLGRPWRPYARTVFINTVMGGHITAVGWDNWRNPANEKTAYYAEYNSTGPGANPTGRVGWSHQLTKKEANKYTLKNILADWEPEVGSRK